MGALWRLRGYLKPFRFQMIVMFAAAFGAVAAEICIPLLTMAVVDGAIAPNAAANMTTIWTRNGFR